MKRSIFLLLLPALFLVPPVRFSASPVRADEPPSRVTLTLHPAAETAPALRYRLLPSLYERKKGNAAPMYAKAMLVLRDAGDDFEGRKKLLAGPLAACTKEVVEPLVGDTAFELARLASLREHCDWELPFHEQNMMAIVLPELYPLRSLATVVVLQARAQVAAGEFAAAIDTLRIAYAMARHVGETPILVNGFVGLTIQDQADTVLLELVRQPGAPNLYWSLTALPTPLVEERHGIEGEMHVLDFTWRRWNEFPEQVPDEKEIRKILDDYVEFVALASLDNTTPAEARKLADTALATLPTAGRRRDVREYLVRSGVTEERLKELTDLQLAMLYSRLKYDELRDLSFRWMAVPYAEAKPGLQAAAERLRAAKSSQEELLPLASLLVPALRQTKAQHARARRRIDVLRLIEALRLYAAEHDGGLPKTLSELQAKTPIPADALTGRPLDYRAGDGGATLTLPEAIWEGRETTLVYEIRIAEKK
jgi:hypothetical protein